MAYVISDECVSCGTCAAECPAEAISEGAEHFEIDADACLTVELALTPVLQKQSIQLNNFIHINQKAAASAAAFLYSVTYPGAFVQIFSQQQLLPLFVQAAVCVSHNQAICIFLHLHSVPSVPA